MQVYADLWPTLNSLLSQFAAKDSQIPEKVVKLTKHAWRCTRDCFPLEFLAALLEEFFCLYSALPVSSFVYAVEVIVTVFYPYPAYEKLVCDAFARVCHLTFAHLQHLHSLQDSPELGEDFFGLLARYCRYAPTIIVSYACSDPRVVQLTLAAIGVEHKDVAKSLYCWVEALCKLLWKSVQDCTSAKALPQAERRSKHSSPTTPRTVGPPQQPHRPSLLQAHARTQAPPCRG